MSTQDRTVAAGAPILLAADRKSRYLESFRPGRRFECHLGFIVYPEVLYWGQRLTTNCGQSLTVLRPTHSEVMTMLKRRTTVVYPKEAGRILLELGVFSGGRFAEVGSGSGALGYLLASMLGQTGRLYSFDRDPAHQQQAYQNLERTGLLERVIFALRDPARDGFGVAGLDGLFVDVPEPWTLVVPGAQALAGGAPWVSLSPTIEQIVRTDRALFDAGFVDRRMLELSEREWKLFPGRMRPQDRAIGHTAFLLTARRGV